MVCVGCHSPWLVPRLLCGSGRHIPVGGASAAEHVQPRLKVFIEPSSGVFTAQSCWFLVSQQWAPGHSMHWGGPVAVSVHAHILRQLEANWFITPPPCISTGHIFVYSLKVKNFKGSWLFIGGGRCSVLTPLFVSRCLLPSWPLKCKPFGNCYPPPSKAAELLAVLFFIYSGFSFCGGSNNVPHPKMSASSSPELENTPEHMAKGGIEAAGYPGGPGGRSHRVHMSGGGRSRLLVIRLGLVGGATGST